MDELTRAGAEQIEEMRLIETEYYCAIAKNPALWKEHLSKWKKAYEAIRAWSTLPPTGDE